MKSTITQATRRSLVFMFALMVALSGANLLFTVHVVQQGNAARCMILRQRKRTPSCAAPPNSDAPGGNDS